MAIDYAERARALVGTRFRPQGRSSEDLDCVGLVLAVYRIDGDAVRRDYQLRGRHGAEVRQALSRFFRRVAKHSARPGDALLLAVAPDQLHLAVRTGSGFVHAHAGLRKVVETPGEPQWPILGVYRKRTRERSS